MVNWVPTHHLSLLSDIAEEGPVSLTIQCHLCDRTRVTVHWNISEVISDDIASSDLNPVSGILQINEGVHQEVLFIQPEGKLPKLASTP